MPKQAKHIRVGKLFLKQVHDRMSEMVKELREKNKRSPLKKEAYDVLKTFTRTFPIHDTPKQFFRQFYVTKLMKSETQPIKENGTERIARYVRIFGLLRTLFLGILSGDPRIGFLSKRVRRYAKTRQIVDILESFVNLYRNEIGFTKRTLPKHILASANTFSACEQKPKNLCFPPKCEYIHHTRRAKGYCRTKKTRKVHHKK
jgi:hypothetical protein